MASVLDAMPKRRGDKHCHTCPDILERGNKTRGLLLDNQLGKCMGWYQGLHKSSIATWLWYCHDGSKKEIMVSHHGHVQI